MVFLDESFRIESDIHSYSSERNHMKISYIFSCENIIFQKKIRDMFTKIKKKILKIIILL